MRYIMEEEIMRYLKRSGILKKDKNFIKVLINIYKYYKIYKSNMFS